MSFSTEDLFDTIAKIAENRIANLQYDKTVICKVVNNDDAKNNNYTVSDGSVEFVAEGDGSKYQINDSVRVLILNGDYSDKKFIQGRYNATDATKPITYISPMESVLNLTDNILAGENLGTFSLEANGETKEDHLATIWFDANQIYNSDIYNRMFLKASFYSAFDSFDMRNGDYGLHIILIRKDKDDKIQRSDLYFSALRDMIGDPYNFKIFTNQEIVYELSSWPDDVIGAQIYFYQDQNFKYYDAATQTLQPFSFGINEITGEEIHLQNLKVKDIYMGFGSEIHSIPDNQLTIYTNDSLNYDHLIDVDTLALNQKEIGLIWYNKTEDNQYIGFSDGVYDIQKDPETGKIIGYDENTYIQASAQDTRLLNQMEEGYPKDVEGLTVKANKVDNESYCKSIHAMISKDLLPITKGLLEHLRGWPVSDLPTHLNDLQDISKLISGPNSFEEWYISLIQIYDEILKSDVTKESISIEDKNKYLNDNGIQLINDLLSNISTMINSMKTKVENTYRSYYDVYTNYTIRLDNFSKKIKTLLDKLTANYNTDVETLDSMPREGDIPDYNTNKDFSEYENKYSIYWFNQRPGYTDSTYPYLGEGWEFIPGSLNVGLPSLGEDPNNPGHNLKKPAATDPNRTLTQLMYEDGKDPRKTQTFKAVLFYNHNKYESNTITFTNDSDTQDLSAADIDGALSIEHGQYSQESYQSYGANGYLINAGDSHRKRTLNIAFEGVDGSGTESLIGATVYWYVPRNSTMLTVFNTDITDDDWYTSRIDSFRTVEALSELGKKTRYYRVNGDVYKYNNTNTQWEITTAIPSQGLIDEGNYKEGYDCYYRQIGFEEKTLDDGTTITIVKEEDLQFFYHISDYYVATATQNGIYCKVVKGDKTYYAETFMTFSSFGTSGTDYTLALIPDARYPAYTNNLMGDFKNLEVDVTLYDAENKKIQIDSEACEFSTLFGTQYSVTNIPLDGPEINGCTIIGNTLTTFGDILTCTITNVNIDSLDKAITLTAQMPIAYARNEAYYIEGATMVLYDTSGGNPSFYKKPYKLFNKHDNREIANISWNIEYFKADGIKLEVEELEAYGLSSLVQLDTDNSLKVPIMYLNNQNIYPIVYAKGKQGAEDEDTIYWAQPILVMQNHYASPMINRWDGKLQISDEDNTILSLMMGAGYKDEENRFHGILMGGVGGASGDDATTTGLYGYHEGAQSFAFKIDGTGFIGRSGKGQILLNGNTSEIKSQSYADSNGGTGLRLDLDNGILSIKNNTKPLILLNAKDTGHTDVPLMYIKNSDDNILLYIDTNEYYLSSANYAENTSGTKFNLNTGYIDAYNFKLTSNGIRLDANPTNITDKYLDIGIDEDNTGSLYFTKDGTFALSHGTTPLLYVSSDDYYLKTSNYAVDDNGMITGVKFDLKNNKLLAGDFQIQASNVLLLDSSPDKDDDPYFRITGSENNLLYFSEEDNYLCSNNYSSTEGMKIDLDDGTITAYTFKLISDGIVLNSSPEENENYIEIGDDNNYIKFTKENKLDINATNFCLNTTDLYFSDSPLESDPLSIILKAGENFYVTSLGHLYTALATIGGWSVDDSNIYKDTTMISSGTSETNAVTTLSGKNAYKRFSSGVNVAYGAQTKGINENITCTKDNTTIVIDDNEEEYYQMLLQAEEGWRISSSVQRCSITYYWYDAVDSEWYPSLLPETHFTVSIINNNTTIEIKIKKTSDITTALEDGDVSCSFYYELTTLTDVMIPRFCVLDNGELYASDAIIQGSFFADSGSIGGWNIDKTGLCSIGQQLNDRSYQSSIQLNTDLSDNSLPALAIGTLDILQKPTDETFTVSKDGSCHIPLGQIGPFTINPNYLSAPRGALYFDGFKIYRSVYKLNKIDAWQRNEETKELIITYGENTNADSGAIMIRPNPVIGNIAARIAVSRMPSSTQTGATFYLKVDSVSPFSAFTVEVWWANVTQGDVYPTTGKFLFSVPTGAYNSDTELYEATSNTKYNSYNDFGCDFWKTDYIGFGITEIEAKQAAQKKNWKIEENLTKVIEENYILPEDKQSNYYNVQIKGHLVPYSDGKYDLGVVADPTSVQGIQKKWRNAYFTGDVYENNSTSDIRVKNSIMPLSEEYEVFFDKMQPTRYKYNEGTSNRYHTGFIAQQLVTALEESKLTTLDFAGLMLSEPNTKNECWYLRRDEFVALNTWQIQKLKPRMTEAEERIYKLEQELQELKLKLLID